MTNDAEAIYRLMTDECCVCGLHATRINVVVGEGRCANGIMFVGEAPGEDEDVSGRPFVGAAGKTLRRLIAEAGLVPEECRITNIVKCRPPGNRKPTRGEISSCIGHLEAEISTFRPKVIVAVGLTSSQVLTGSKKPMHELASAPQEFYYEGVRVMPAYHTSALCINRNKDAVDQILEGIRMARGIAG